LRYKNSNTDKELFKLIAGNNEEAFSECVHLFTPKLYPYIKSIIHADLWAEDLLQDIFIKLWKGREKLAEIDQPAAYLTRMAANLSLDFLKHRSIEVKTQYRIARQAEQHNAPPDGTPYDQQYYENLLKDAQALLTPRQQHIYLLRYEENYSYEQIAEKLAISRNTVRNHLVAAMEVIRNYFRKKMDVMLLFVIAWLI